MPSNAKNYLQDYPIISRCFLPIITLDSSVEIANIRSSTLMTSKSLPEIPLPSEAIFLEENKSLRKILTKVD